MLPKSVKIVEVGPRDGLQAESVTLSPEKRIEFINLLSDTGLMAIEVGSFVSPSWIPQLAHSDQVYQEIERKPGVDYSLLVPNQKGYEEAIQNSVQSISVFTAASETFNTRNINASIEESLANFADFIPKAKALNMRVRGYISCAIACPFEGPTPPERVADITEKLLNIGCDEISLGDTIGVGTPAQVQQLLQNIHAPKEKIAVHFHDTYGQGIANIYAALEMGISIIDSSVSGLGGCPYAPGASGNVATEDVVYLLKGLGVETGINMTKLLKSAEFIDNNLSRRTESKTSFALRINR
jgi:isopropylmalate/homocitrate/citramalate synthase